MVVFAEFPLCHGLRRGIEVWQASLCCFHWPLGGVAVAREDHVLVLLVP